MNIALRVQILFFFSGLYFSVFGLTRVICVIKSLYSVRIREKMEQEKVLIWNVDTFIVYIRVNIKVNVFLS